MSLDLTERYLRGEVVFDGALLHVRRDVVRLPDGREAVREVVRHPGAAVVVPLFDDGRVLLVRQYRYAIGRTLIELPAGKLDPGESALETAQRELREETGHAARHWQVLGVIHPCVGYADEAIALFLARGLQAGPAQPDAGEFLETLTLPFDEALEWVRSGRISDAKTVAALLWVAQFEAGAAR